MDHTSGLGVLSSYSEAIVMPQTSVTFDLLQPFQVLTELRVDTVGQDLRVLAINDITLSIEEPGWDLVLGWVLDDCDDSLKFFSSELSGTVQECDISRIVPALTAFFAPFSDWSSRRTAC